MFSWRIRTCSSRSKDWHYLLQVFFLTYNKSFLPLNFNLFASVKCFLRIGTSDYSTSPFSNKDISPWGSSLIGKRVPDLSGLAVFLCLCMQDWECYRTISAMLPSKSVVPNPRKLERAILWVMGESEFQVSLVSRSTYRPFSSTQRNPISTNKPKNINQNKAKINNLLC